MSWAMTFFVAFLLWLLMAIIGLFIAVGSPTSQVTRWQVPFYFAVIPLVAFAAGIANVVEWLMEKTDAR